MPELPQYFEHTKEMGEKTHLHPFSFVQEDKAFHIGPAEVAAKDFDPFLFEPTGLGLKFHGMDADETVNHAALLPSFGSILGGPKLHKLISEKPELINEAYDQMFAVYSLFAELDDFYREPSFTHFGFAAGLTQNGDLRLQVLGNCACLGPNPMGFLIEDKYEAGFAEYELHNTDEQAQRTSLYAGFGHIARLANE